VTVPIVRSRNRWTPRRIALLVVACAALVTALTVFDETQRDSPSATSSLPSVALPFLRDSSSQFDLADLRGTPLVLNFFFSDCPPCAKELPLIESAAKATVGKVRFVGVDHGESAVKGVAMADRFGLSYTLLNDETGSLAPLVGAIAFPTTLFVDREGRIIRRHLGAIAPGQLNSNLQAIS
jgi:cytochrome c biogenesis protein CcmG, thiol:disulfide interchange protein DsbE